MHASTLVLSISILLSAVSSIDGTTPIYPKESWLRYASVEDAGFSKEGMDQARKIYDQSKSSACLVIYKGAVLASWGDIEARYICHSIRKSLLSGLYGVAIEEGIINPNTTLRRLGIADIPPRLSNDERRATIFDLLKARSGVYHPAASETPSMKAKRPNRESHKAGTYFYYNNWDFNALGSIYTKLTEKGIFDAFDQVFALPLQMQDYLPLHCWLHYDQELSMHPAYHFRMSARDLARFGLLYARGGQWDGSRIIPESWVRETATPHSTFSNGGGYGLLWWIPPVEEFRHLHMFSAHGVGGQTIDVLPDIDMVVVRRTNTFTEDRATNNDGYTLIKAILSAAVNQPVENPTLIPLKTVSSSELDRRKMRFAENLLNIKSSLFPDDLKSINDLAFKGSAGQKQAIAKLNELIMYIEQNNLSDHWKTRIIRMMKSTILDNIERKK